VFTPFSSGIISISLKKSYRQSFPPEKLNPAREGDGKRRVSQKLAELPVDAHWFFVEFEPRYEDWEKGEVP
jgi:hypothetical protein